MQPRFLLPLVNHIPAERRKQLSQLGSAETDADLQLEWRCSLGIDTSDRKDRDRKDISDWHRENPDAGLTTPGPPQQKALELSPKSPAHPSPARAALEGMTPGGQAALRLRSWRSRQLGTDSPSPAGQHVLPPRGVWVAHLLGDHRLQLWKTYESGCKVSIVINDKFHRQVVLLCFVFKEKYSLSWKCSEHRCALFVCLSVCPHIPGCWHGPRNGPPAELPEG